MPEDLADGIARENEIAEVASSILAVGHVDDRARDALVSRQMLRELGELVLAAAPGEQWIREIVRDLLQAEHVKVGDRLRVLDDASGIDLTVDAAAPLDIPGDEFHRMTGFVRLT